MEKCQNIRSNRNIHLCVLFYIYTKLMRDHSSVAFNLVFVQLGIYLVVIAVMIQRSGILVYLVF